MAFAAAGSAEFYFRFFGLGEDKFRSDGDVGVEFGVEPLDASEHELGQLDRGKLALSEKFSDGFDGSEDQVRIVHA
jgi:hypothetical protein